MKGLDLKFEGKIPIRLIHPTNFSITQDFGANAVNFYTQLGMLGHNGIDYGCPTGSKIIAPCDLEIANIIYAKDNPGYGTNLIGRSRSFNVGGKIYRIEMVFGHLQGFIKTTIGYWFKIGEDMAISDNTGQYTTGPHLHHGCRIVEATSAGGWLVVNRENGYLGYFDQSELISYKEALPTIDGKIVYAGKQVGAQHFLFKDGKFQWVTDEYAFTAGGFLFSEAIQIPTEYLNPAVKMVYSPDFSTRQARLLIQVGGLLAYDSARAKMLYEKYSKY